MWQPSYLHNGNSWKDRFYTATGPWLYQQPTGTQFPVCFFFTYNVWPGIVKFRNEHRSPASPKWKIHMLVVLSSVTPRHHFLSEQAAAHDLGNRLALVIDWNIVFSHDVLSCTHISELVHCDDTVPMDNTANIIAERNSMTCVSVKVVIRSPDPNYVLVPHRLFDNIWFVWIW